MRKVFFFLFSCSLLLSFGWIFPWSLQAIEDETIGSVRLAKNETKGSPENIRSGRDQVIETYEREKLAKFKRNIGRRFLVVRTARPVQFYQRPEYLQRTFTLQKEKEGFLIVDVVQNDSKTIYFYWVVFDSGETGYLMADGNELELRILDGSIIPLTKRAGAREKREGRPKGTTHQAVSLVKNHLIKLDPMTGRRLTVESRMAEAKARSFPNLIWRYEAREIGDGRCRVIQYTEGEGKFSLLRTWIVDLSTLRVSPENRAAQDLYR